jgi:hypothetical protein
VKPAWGREPWTDLFAIELLGDPGAITRFNTDQDSLNHWFGAFERGDVSLYTSDGDPETVTIPDPLPAYLQNELDPGLIAASGKTLVTYALAHHPALADTPDLAPGAVVSTTDEGVRLRRDPSTTGKVIRELPAHAELTIVAGPVTADGYTWWNVSLADGTTGWLVADFLRGPPHA